MIYQRCCVKESFLDAMQRSFFGPGFQGFATILQQIQYIVPPPAPESQCMKVLKLKMI